MSTELLEFAVGLGLLAGGAELLVRGASRLALGVGISPLVVGLTVVALGTSAPEIAVAVEAAVDGNPSLAIGNVIGSNIANVLLILGLSAMLAPLLVAEQIVRQEVPIMIGVSALLLVLALDGTVSRLEAGLLLLLGLCYLCFVTLQARRLSARMRDAVVEQVPPADRPTGHRPAQVLLVLGGLGMLVVGADWLIESSVSFARALGVSDLVIGLTVVAVGTSLPEIATSVVAVLRGQRDLAVGNVVGSNLFNILLCLGPAGVVSPVGLAVPESARGFDLWVMLAVAFACLPVFLAGRTIRRWEGALFFAYYLAYLAYLVLSARQHQSVPMFSSVMLVFVLPLTATTLTASFLLHRMRARPGR